MSRRKKTDGVQDALIPDEMSPLKLLDFNAGNAKIKQAAVDLRRSVNTAKPMSSKTEYLAKFQHIDAVTEAIFDVDVLAQHIVDCAEAINRLLTYPREARRTIMLDDLHRSLKPFEESAVEGVPDYPVRRRKHRRRIIRCRIRHRGRPEPAVGGPGHRRNQGGIMSKRKHERQRRRRKRMPHLPAHQNLSIKEQ